MWLVIAAIFTAKSGQSCPNLNQTMQIKLAKFRAKISDFPNSLKAESDGGVKGFNRPKTTVQRYMYKQAMRRL